MDGPRSAAEKEHFARRRRAGAAERAHIKAMDAGGFKGLSAEDAMTVGQAVKASEHNSLTIKNTVHDKDQYAGLSSADQAAWKRELKEHDDHLKTVAGGASYGLSAEEAAAIGAQRMKEARAAVAFDVTF